MLYKHPNPPWPAFSSSQLEREVSARLIIPIIMDGFVISHWVLALDDFIIVSTGKRRSHLAVSIKVSLQRTSFGPGLFITSLHTTPCPHTNTRFLKPNISLVQKNRNESSLWRTEGKVSPTKEETA